MLSTTPIQFRLKGGQKAVGYDALLLPMVCEVYLKLRDSLNEQIAAAQSDDEASTAKSIARRAALSRWGAELPQASHDGPLHIGNEVLLAANLRNGKRLLAQGAFLQAIGRSRTPKAGTGGLTSVDGLPFFFCRPNYLSHSLAASTHTAAVRQHRQRPHRSVPAFGALKSPHEALGGRTPASLWHASPRRYDPQPREWEYGSGAEVQRLGSNGQLKLQGRWWQISEALRGERVQLVRVEDRVLVYYCQSLIREIDLAEQRSTAVGHWRQALTCKGCGGNAV